MVNSLILFILGFILLFFAELNFWLFGLMTILLFGFLLLSALFEIADYLTGNGINEAAKFHILKGMEGHGLEQFIDLLSIGSVILLMTLALLLVIVFLFRKRITLQKKLYSFLSFGLLFSAIYVHPAKAIFLASSASSQYFHGINFSDYYRDASITSKNQLPNQEPMNLVFIYAEGLERTYLNEEVFPGLMPNIKALEKQAISFTEIKQVLNTGWTIAGMVASQCSIPLTEPVSYNLFSDKVAEKGFMGNAMCMGDLLRTQGYSLSYFGGASLVFVNKGVFYKTHGFSEIYGKEELQRRLDNPSYLSRWGLYDDSLFEIAREDLLKKAASNKPFATFMLTLDTHAPDGYPSKLCQGISYREGDNKMLNSVACADYQLATFISELRADSNFSNTLIVLSSDHLAMKNSAWKELRELERRNLLLFISADRSRHFQVTQSGSMFDVAPMVLSEMGFDAHVGLGRNLLEGEESLVEEYPESLNPILQAWMVNIEKLWDE